MDIRDWFQAVIAGDIESVRQGILDGFPLGSRTDRGKTPLMLAAQLGHGELVALLLAEGAAVGEQIDPTTSSNPQEGAQQDPGDDSDLWAVLAAEELHASVPEAVEHVRRILPSDGGASEAPAAVFEEPPDLNTGESLGTALNLAIANDHGTVVHHLLEAGADAGSPSWSHYPSPLEIAARQGSVDCIAMLLEAGAEAGRFTFESPLAIAIRHGYREVVGRLLAGGADASEAADGRLPLEAALAIQDDEIVDLLLRYGADPAAPGTNDEPLVVQAARLGDHRILDRFLPLVPEEMAARAREVWRSLGDERAKVPLGESLRLAVWNRQVQQVERLLAAGAPVDARGTDGFTSLMVAAYLGEPELLDRLLAAGADPGLQSRTRLVGADAEATPLTLAVVGARHPEVVEKLAGAGADLDAPDAAGRTPLMLAVRYPAMARLLLALGADRELADQDGQTAADHARRIHGQVQDLEVQLRAGGETQPEEPRAFLGHELVRAAEGGDTAEIRRLLEQGAPVDFIATDGLSALMHAAFLGHAEAAEALLQAGASADLRSTGTTYGEKGATALILAAGARHSEAHQRILRLLAEAGADLNARNDLGSTALMEAMPFLEPASLLLELGADPKSRNFQGQTAMDFARFGGRWADPLMELLKAHGAVDY